MGDTLDDLLTRARLNAGVQHLVREPLRLDQLVEGVVEQVGDTARAGITAALGAEGAEGAQRSAVPVLTVTVEECTIRADAHLVSRAVANLVENALRHGHRAGEAARVEVSVRPPGRVTVTDQGPGVDPEVASALFDRFRGSGASIGLGLSISLWAARLHGGTLTVENGGTRQAPSGASFVLDLPA
jgi:two-component system OmpR family sensor kinase